MELMNWTMRTGYDRFMDYHLTHKDHHSLNINIIINFFHFAGIATFNSTIIYTLFLIIELYYFVVF